MDSDSPKTTKRDASTMASRVADRTLKALPEYGTTRMSDGYAMRYPSILIRTQPDYGESTANLPRGDALLQRQSSTNTECDFYKATDGNWYMDLEDYNEDYDTGEQIEGDMNSYGPFPSFRAAVKYLDQNFANPGGWNEDDSGRRKPPRKPINPRRRRADSNRVADRALEARNPPFHEAAKADEAMGEAYRSLVDLKLGFDSWEEIPPSAKPLYDAINKAMSAVAKVRQDHTYQIRMQVQRKRYGASSSRVAARHLEACGGTEVAKLYFHLSNGGATYKVIDSGKGPEFIASIGSFSQMDSQVRIETTPDGLRRLADMLHIAASHERFSEHWDTGGLTPSTDDLATHKKDQMMRSMVESMAWWNAREDEEAEEDKEVAEIEDTDKDSNEYGAPTVPRIASQEARDARYNKNLLEVRGIIERISGLLSSHESKQAADTKDWGYAGDLDHVQLQLASVERFLTDDRG